MERENWLAEQDNQEDLYAICEQAIVSLAPEEEPLFAEIFPEYVALAQKGKVVTGSMSSKPFSLTGGEDLVTLILIPFVVELFNTLLLSYGLLRLKELRNRRRERNQNANFAEGEARPPNYKEELYVAINEAINQGDYAIPDQKQFLDSLIVAINGYMEAAD